MAIQLLLMTETAAACLGHRRPSPNTALCKFGFKLIFFLALSKRVESSFVDELSGGTVPRSRHTNVQHRKSGLHPRLFSRGSSAVKSMHREKITLESSEIPPRGHSAVAAHVPYVQSRRLQSRAPSLPPQPKAAPEDAVPPSLPVPNQPVGSDSFSSTDLTPSLPTRKPRPLNVPSGASDEVLMAWLMVTAALMALLACGPLICHVVALCRAHRAAKYGWSAVSLDMRALDGRLEWRSCGDSTASGSKRAASPENASQRRLLRFLLPIGRPAPLGPSSSRSHLLESGTRHARHALSDSVSCGGRARESEGERVMQARLRLAEARRLADERAAAEADTQQAHAEASRKQKRWSRWISAASECDSSQSRTSSRRASGVAVLRRSHAQATLHLRSSNSEIRNSGLQNLGRRRPKSRDSGTKRSQQTDLKMTDLAEMGSGTATLRSARGLRQSAIFNGRRTSATRRYEANAQLADERGGIIPTLSVDRTYAVDGQPGATGSRRMANVGGLLPPMRPHRSDSWSDDELSTDFRGSALSSNGGRSSRSNGGRSSHLDHGRSVRDVKPPFGNVRSMLEKLGSGKSASPESRTSSPRKLGNMRTSYDASVEDAEDDPSNGSDDELTVDFRAVPSVKYPSPPSRRLIDMWGTYGGQNTFALPQAPARTSGNALLAQSDHRSANLPASMATEASYHRSFDHARYSPVCRRSAARLPMEDVGQSSASLSSSFDLDNHLDTEMSTDYRPRQSSPLRQSMHSVSVDSNQGLSAHIDPHTNRPPPILVSFAALDAGSSIGVLTSSPSRKLSASPSPSRTARQLTGQSALRDVGPRLSPELAERNSDVDTYLTPRVSLPPGAILNTSPTSAYSPRRHVEACNRSPDSPRTSRIRRTSHHDMCRNSAVMEPLPEDSVSVPPSPVDLQTASAILIDNCSPSRRSCSNSNLRDTRASSRFSGSADTDVSELSEVSQRV